jgi:hypothetical protein
MAVRKERVGNEPTTALSAYRLRLGLAIGGGLASLVAFGVLLVLLVTGTVSETFEGPLLVLAIGLGLLVVVSVVDVLVLRRRLR